MPVLVISRRTLALGAVGFVLGLAVWLVWEFRPSQQLHRAFERLTTAVERRDWQKAGAFLAEDYRDSFGFDKATALEAGREIFAHFLVLEITTEPASVAVSGREGTVTTRPRLAGSGSPVAQMIIARCNELREPTVFSWRRTSWKPWDWELASVAQPELAGGP